MATQVAFLRGINVGGKNKLPMAELTALFEAAGATGVKTYIQSGNVVFACAASSAARIAATVEKRITERHKLRVPVVVRTAEELLKVARDNPFLARGADPQTLHVMFLAEKPNAQAVAQLDTKRSPPDEFQVRGRDVFLRLPNGVARTRLSNDYFDRTLATISTLRNWRTVLALVELTGSA
jgi:uncharacterized protein (DUF1697 family)